MNPSFYPLQFDPILKERIWGGEKLKTQFNKSIISKTTGESWELSAVEGDVSVVSEGDFKGKLITDLIDLYPNQILGTAVFKRFGKQLPLLFKFLDAREDLSIQVHPNDDLAKKRHNSFGKTEMWYVMQADEGAEIIVGFKENATQAEYLNSLESKKLLSILNSVKVHEGAVFFLETGTVHAIGAGLVIAEIQQTSDITYRLYDFERKDANGVTRELHVDLALEAINFQKSETQKFYFKEPNSSNPVVDCSFFTTNFIPLTQATDVQKNGESFTVYMCVDGNFEIKVGESSFSYKKGDTVLIPAGCKNYILSGTGSILEIYIS
jgi:mannose-6-phosphate isomerase